MLRRRVHVLQQYKLMQANAMAEEKSSMLNGENGETDKPSYSELENGEGGQC